MVFRDPGVPPSINYVYSGVSAKADPPAIDLPDNIDVVLAYTAADDFDTDAIHDNVTTPTRFTIPKAGKWQVNAQALLLTGADATGWFRLQIRKNGATIVGEARASRAWVTTDAVALTCQVVRTLNLVVADFVEIVARQQSGATRSLGNAVNPPWVGCRLDFMGLQ